MALVKIQTQTLLSNAAQIEFTTIPGTYKTLYMLLNIRSANTGGPNRVALEGKFNNSSSGYSRSRGYAYDNVPSISADQSTSETVLALGSANNASEPSYVFSAMECWIFDYASSNNIKVMTSKIACLGTTSNYWVTGYAHMGWSNTAAITSIQIFGNTGNIAAGSTASLYGLG